MGAVTPGETLGTLYNIHVGSNKTKQHMMTIHVGYSNSKTTLEAKSNINLNASEPVIGPGTNDHHTKC